MTKLSRTHIELSTCFNTSFKKLNDPRRTTISNIALNDIDNGSVCYIRIDESGYKDDDKIKIYIERNVYKDDYCVDNI